MMMLVHVEEVRSEIVTPLSDAALRRVIERVEQQITDEIGAPFSDAPISQTVYPATGDCHLFLARRVSAVQSVTETAAPGDAGVALALNSDYTVNPRRAQLTRLGGSWGFMVTVSYVPTDQRERRRGVIIDLVRLELSRTALAAEAVAGEYSYTAPANWDAERRRIMSRIAFGVV